MINTEFAIRIAKQRSDTQAARKCEYARAVSHIPFTQGVKQWGERRGIPTKPAA